MSIGNSIAVSVPTVGATVYTLDKAYDGKYADVTSVTNGDGNAIPVELSLKPASVAGPHRAINGTLRHRPAMYDGSLGASQGSVSVSFTATGVVGADISQADIILFIKYLASVMTQSSVITALLSGSVE